VIASRAITKIVPNDVILTYGMSEVILKVIIAAYNRAGRGADFRVVVVDSRPLMEGKKMAKKIVSSCPDLPVSYVASERSERAVRTPAGATTRQIRIAQKDWHHVAQRRTVCVEAMPAVIALVADSLRQQLQIRLAEWVELHYERGDEGLHGRLRSSPKRIRSVTGRVRERCPRCTLE